MRQSISFICILFLTSAVRADDVMDFLLNNASTKPATRPATLPATRPDAPFGDRRARSPEARPGTLILSSDKKIETWLSTTPEKPIRIWDEKDKQYKDVSWELIRSIEAKIVWEREEREWRFKESGSDIKEYSGKAYPAREMQYVVELVNGQKITGGIVAPVFAWTDEQPQLFVLNKRTKGEVGMTLKDLIYVKRIELKESEKKKPS